MWRWSHEVWGNGLIDSVFIVSGRQAWLQPMLVPLPSRRDICARFLRAGTKPLSRGQFMSDLKTTSLLAWNIVGLTVAALGPT